MNHWQEHWHKLLQQLPPAIAQRAAWLLPGLVALAFAGWLAWPREEQVPLFPGSPRSASELRTALTRLKQSGLPEARVRNGQLLVPASRLAEAQSAVESLASPANPASRPAENSAIGSFWPASESQRQEQLDSQRAAELVQMFQADPNIASAKLVWNRNRRRSFGQDPRTTVVLGLTPRDGRQVSRQLAESFQMAVVSAFGLGHPDDVTLIVNGPEGARWLRGESGERPQTLDRGSDYSSPTDPLTPARAAITHAAAAEPAAGESPVDPGHGSWSQPDVADANPPRELPANPAARLQEQLTEKLAWIPGVRIRVDRLSTALAPHVARRPSRPAGAGLESSPVQPTAHLSEPDPRGDRRPYEVVIEVPAKVTRTLAPARSASPPEAGRKPAPTRAEVSRRVEQIVQRLRPTSDDGDPVETSVLVLFAEPVGGGSPLFDWVRSDWFSPLSRGGAWAWGPLTLGAVAVAALPAWIWRRRRRAAARLAPRATGRFDRVHPDRRAGASSRASLDRDDLPEPASLAAQLLNEGSPAAVTQFGSPQPAPDGSAHPRGLSVSPPASHVPPPAGTSPVGWNVASSPAAGSPASGSSPAWAAGHFDPAVPPPSSLSATTLAGTNPPATPHPAAAGLGGTLGTTVGITPAATRPLSPPTAAAQASNLASTEHATFSSWRGDVGEVAREFRMLDDCSADEWRQLLAGETPQSIACVVARLPAAQATFVLRLLPAATRLDVIRRLTGLELPAPSILREFGLALEDRLRAIRSAASSRDAAGGLRRAPRPTDVVTPSESLPPAPGNRAPATSAVTSASAPLPGAGGGPPPASAPTVEFDTEVPPAPFEDLRMLDDGALRELFVMFDLEVWATALAGAPRPIVEKLLGSLAPPAAAELQSAINRAGSVPSGRGEEARKAIEQRLAPLRWRGRRSSRAARRGTRP